MKVQSLSDIYTSLDVSEGTIFVVPSIRSKHSDSDYLYQLYKPLIESSSYHVKSLTIFEHFIILVPALLRRKVILHYHWLEFQDLKSMLGIPWKLLCIFLFKLFGGKLVWTIHNLEPHDQKWLDAHLRIQQWMGKIANAIHIHCSSSEILVARKFNLQKDKIKLHPHPYFPTKEVSRLEALATINKKFGIELSGHKPIILLFGQISEYKQIEETLNVIQEENLDVEVIISGTIKKGQEKLKQRLTKRSVKDSRIKFIPNFIEDDDIPYLFNASDLCFFNYKKILTSGAVMLALSYNKNIIAPNIGCLSELKEHNNVQLFSTDKEKRILLKSLISTLEYE